MKDQQLLRYSRQILLPGIDVAGQQRMVDAQVLIVGIGGLGSPVAMYLAAAGVGRLILIDHDVVDLSNLQRQIIHGDADVGRSKVDSAADTLRRLNPDCAVDIYNERFADGRFEELVMAVDVVVDASDNFATRFALNAACVRQRKPLVSGAATRFDGQIAVFDLRSPANPCYRCLYPDSGSEPLSCAESGVVAPLLGVVGSMQAMEVIKLIIDYGECLSQRLLIFDGLHARWRSIKVNKDPDCPVCAANGDH